MSEPESAPKAGCLQHGPECPPGAHEAPRETGKETSQEQAEALIQEVGELYGQVVALARERASVISDRPVDYQLSPEQGGGVMTVIGPRQDQNAEFAYTDMLQVTMTDAQQGEVRFSSEFKGGKQGNRGGNLAIVQDDYKLQLRLTHSRREKDALGQPAEIFGQARIEHASSFDDSHEPPMTREQWERRDGGYPQKGTFDYALRNGQAQYENGCTKMVYM